MPRTRFFRFDCVTLAAAAFCVIHLSILSMAQQAHQRTFSSPEEASTALVSATQKNDETAMIDILGPDAKRIVSSGDEAEDASSRANFVQRYKEMHRLVKEPDGSVVLYIGAHNWPTPIPLVDKGSSWYFDTDAGKKEILYRRIGRNEVSAIRVCQELVAAQKEYYSAQHNEYAQKIVSNDGQHDGLYWKAANGESQSPIGPLLAAAFTQDNQSGDATPYRGYYFRILARQGKDASGGTKSYVVDGKMTQGFAFVSYPAEYRSSGVMTFIVNKDGVVYEKDLGKSTEVVAKEMKAFNPATGWRKAETPQEETAVNQQ